MTDGFGTDHDALPRLAPLAAVVDREQADAAIESLRTEGVYDDDRSVRPFGDDAVAIPVSDPPSETTVREVVHQVDPEPRPRNLESLLRARGWSDEDLESAPGSWAVVGTVLLVRIPPACPDEDDVAGALLDLHGGADVVLAHEGVTGLHREPRTRRLAGDGDTETIHVEHGTKYALDPTRVMFSPGNAAERVRMGEVVSPGERVFDMFAGIGYFTLPMARAGATVTATEINPESFRYLLENAMLNDVADRIEAYRADCRDVSETVSADRVVMGYYETGPEEYVHGDDTAGNDSFERSGRDGAVRSTGSGEATVECGDDEDGYDPLEFLGHGLSALEPGGILHYHDVGPDDDPWSQPVDRVASVADERDRTFAVVDRRRVKSVGPGVVHVVIDARVE